MTVFNYISVFTRTSKDSNKSPVIRNLMALYRNISNQYRDPFVLKTVKSLVPKDLTPLNDCDTKKGKIKSLLDWFKHDFMSWTPNYPICNRCAACLGESVPMRVEIAGGPSWKLRATEIHSCEVCGQRNTFPRYGDIPKIAAARTGRCTEWSALFGAIMNSLGEDTRIIHDFLDHCWNEIRIDGNWVHLDCTLTYPISFNHPYYYEQNWRKKYEYVLAFFGDECVDDVTQRYTQDMGSIYRRRKKNVGYLIELND